MTDFLSMGGYALYVWGSYGVTLAAIVIEVVLLQLRKRNISKELGGIARQDETGAA